MRETGARQGDLAFIIACVCMGGLLLPAVADGYLVLGKVAVSTGSSAVSVIERRLGQGVGLGLAEVTG